MVAPQDHPELPDSTNRELENTQILVSDDDVFGKDITKMSNFLDSSISLLHKQVKSGAGGFFHGSFPVDDINMALKLSDFVDAVSTEEFNYVLDFDSLPPDVLKKLKSGEYSIGESRQVEGNARAVIIDGDKTRVKDVTARQVVNTTDISQAVQGIAEQAQMRQLSRKLDEIKELQLYQIQRERDRDINTPFLTARDFILDAQSTESADLRTHYLTSANKYLMEASNSISRDIETLADDLNSKTRFPIFQNSGTIRSDIDYLIYDLKAASQLAGLQIFVLELLGDNASAANAIERYRKGLLAFCDAPKDGSRKSVAYLIHCFYDYPSDSDHNFWYDFGISTKSRLSVVPKFNPSRKTLLLETAD